MAPSKLTRRSLLGGASGSLIAAAPAAARLFRGGSAALATGLAPDGTFITTADLGSTMTTAHGTWGWDPLERAPTPGWGIGPFHVATLNGQMVGPGLVLGSWQKLIVDHGGNVYGITFDQLFYQWDGGQWQPNFNVNGIIDPPAATPVPHPLPNLFAGPYAASTDGTMISGGTGAVITREGEWTFGAVNGSGWDLQRNGQPIIFNDSYTVAVGVSQMKVDSGGRLFYQRVDDSNWYLWAAHQQNPSTAGAPGSPVPVAISFSPPRGAVSASAPAGTLICSPFVTMSNGGVFTGALSVSLDAFGIQLAVSSGLTIVKGSADISSEIGQVPYMTIRATQNGTTIFGIYWVAVSAGPVVPVVTITPVFPLGVVPNGTPLGAIVATVTVTMSDASPFTGTIGFAAPNFDDGGIYALSGTGATRSLIINEAGPGIGTKGGNTSSVTIEALP